MDKIELFSLPATPLEPDSIGILRLICLDNQQFAAFSGRNTFSAIIRLDKAKGPAPDCDSNGLQVMQEKQVPKVIVREHESSVIRRFYLKGGLSLLLLADKNGGGSLIQEK